MAIDYDWVHKTQRIYMLRFETVKVAKPKHYYPEIDPRGFHRQTGTITIPRLQQGPHTDRGPVLGTTEGDIVYIRLRRVKIGKEAPLFVTSSDERIMVAFPSWKEVQQLPKTIPSALDNEEVLTLAIKGIKGGAGVDPNVAKVEIRHGSKAGPIVAELTVYVFSKIDVWVVPHRVKISGVPVPSSVNIKELFKPVQAIWQTCGIRFVVRDPIDVDVKSNVDMPGKWSDILPGDIADTYYSSGAINIYFVNQLANQMAILEAMQKKIDPKSVNTSTETLGYTYSPKSARRLKDEAKVGGKDKYFVPLIVCSTNHGQKTTSFSIAHEIGHYLDLPHIDDPFKQRTTPPLDWWSLSSLMRVAHQPDLVMPYQGHLISMKDLYDMNGLANHITDPEWKTARTATKAVQM